MTNMIIQEVPNFCDGVKPKSAEFNTVDELFEIDWVKGMKGDDFHRFSVSGCMLMVESDEGRVWWVIGYIKYVSRLGLPEWKAVREGS